MTDKNTLTDKIITEVTLECLMNKENYEKYRLKTCEKRGAINKKDKKFYRKRIYDVTKKLLNPELYPNEKMNITTDLQYKFETYISSCIEYFKMLDTSDILQEDYKDFLEIDEKNEIMIDENATIDNADQLMMRSIKIQEPNSLEKFVKRKIMKPLRKEIPPQQKDVNLKDPVLKNKGIRKKKNITNTYDKPPDEKK